MRTPKPSDFQLLELVQQEIEQISIQVTIIRGRLVNLQKQIKQYINQDTTIVEINKE